MASPDDMEYGGPADWSDDDMTIPLEARDSSVGMADLRDQEYLEQQSTDGFQKISGIYIVTLPRYLYNLTSNYFRNMVQINHPTNVRNKASTISRWESLCN